MSIDSFTFVAVLILLVVGVGFWVERRERRPHCLICEKEGRSYRLSASLPNGARCKKHALQEEFDQA